MAEDIKLILDDFANSNRLAVAGEKTLDAGGEEIAEFGQAFGRRHGVGVDGLHRPGPWSMPKAANTACSMIRRARSSWGR